MALRVGRTHYIPFRVGTVAAPTAGLNLTSFVVVFTRDNVNITAISQALAVVNNGLGRYCATYVPTDPGFYYLELYNVSSTTLITNSVEIDTALTAADVDNFVSLTQDFGGVGALKPNVPNVADYILSIFYSKDWQVGRTDSSYSVASTTLDAGGNWLSTPLAVTHDTYHVVLQNMDGESIVIRPFLVT